MTYQELVDANASKTFGDMDPTKLEVSCALQPVVVRFGASHASPPLRASAGC